MSRYSRLGSDEEHLPDGFERIGYDADTQRYTFRDARDGSLWQGAEGAEYGTLQRIDQSSTTNNEHDQDIQTWIANDKRETWRMFAPFFLLIALFLMVVWWAISPRSVPTPHCKGPSLPYTIAEGDTCWDIASKSHLDLKDLQAWNPNLDCDHLVPDQHICIPPAKDT